MRRQSTSRLVLALFWLGSVPVLLPWQVGWAQVPEPPGPATGDPAFGAAPQAGSSATGASSAEPETRLQQADRLAEQALTEQSQAAEKQAEGSPTSPGSIPEINVLDLAFRGGVLMIPITLMSVLTVIFGLERALGLRRRKVVPAALIRGLGALVEEKRGFDPRAAYRLAQRFPSAAANVLKAMLLKSGRPLPEIEQTMKEATEREADRLYGNVRFLTLSAAVTPLLGLLGTVQGMIQAFFVTSHLPTGADRAEMLAQGIYTALVTTFAGLCVAIPASILAHYFEGRIQRLLRELEESLLGLLPQFERFEGRLRWDRDQLQTVDVSPPGSRREVPQPPPPPSPAQTGVLP